jgi:hypothetical protein
MLMSAEPSSLFLLFQATFEAFIGIRDDNATEKLKLFGDHLLVNILMNCRNYLLYSSFAI